MDGVEFSPAMASSAAATHLASETARRPCKTVKDSTSSMPPSPANTANALSGPAVKLTKGELEAFRILGGQEDTDRRRRGFEEVRSLHRRNVPKHPQNGNRPCLRGGPGWPVGLVAAQDSGCELGG
jgi:hypothetical protein